MSREESSALELAEPVKQVLEVPQRKQTGLRRKWIQTLLIYFGFFGQGMAFAVYGPSLPDLEIQTRSSTQQVALLFTWRSLGALLGVISSGFAYDCMSPYFLLGLGTLGQGVSVAGVSLWYNLIGLSCNTFLVGIFCGIISVGASSTIVKIWGDQVDPYMQCLHFIVMIGAAVVPLFMKPFLVERSESSLFLQVQEFDKVSHCHQELCNSPSTGITTHSVLYTQLPGVKYNASNPSMNMNEFCKNLEHYLNISLPSLETNQYMPELCYAKEYGYAACNMKHDITNISRKAAFICSWENIDANVAASPNLKVPFLIVTFYLLLSSLVIFVYVSVGKCHILASRSGQNTAKRATKGPGEKGTSFFLVIFFLMMFVYDAVEETYGGLIATFVVKHLGWSKPNGAILTTVFWASTAIVRGATIVLSKYIAANIMLGFHVYILLVSCIVFLIFYKMHNLVVWVCTTTIGIGLSSLFANAFNWACTFLDMTGRRTSVFSAGMFVGSLTMPTLTGFLFDNASEESFIYICVICSCFLFVLYNAALVVVKNLAREVKVNVQNVEEGCRILESKPN